MIKNTANVYHYLCVGMSDTDFKKVLPMNKATWKSPVCKISKKPSYICIIRHEDLKLLRDIFL